MKVLRILGIIVLIPIILILALLILAAFIPAVPTNYTETTQTGEEIEAKYLRKGEDKVKKDQNRRHGINQKLLHLLSGEIKQFCGEISCSGYAKWHRYSAAEIPSTF